MSDPTFNDIAKLLKLLVVLVLVFFLFVLQSECFPIAFLSLHLLCLKAIHTLKMRRG